MDIRQEGLYAVVSTAVSSIDGIQYKTMTNQVNAFLGTMADAFQKMANRVMTASATLAVSGAQVILAAPYPYVSFTVSQGPIQGMVQGQPWYYSGISGALSATPGSAMNTTSAQVRKALVVLEFSALPVTNLAAPTMAFVVGSAMATSAGAMAAGTSAAATIASYFDPVPLPKPGARQVPVGWFNVPNSWTSGDNVSAHMVKTDYQQTQGFDFSLILSGRPQP